MSAMILVLAGIIDETAASFARELASGAAVSLVTCTDLATTPLSLHHPDFAASTITVRGDTISVGDLTGVVNLLPVVFPEELIFYGEAEREYQAAEFHALLTYFLSSLACPVVNRATSSSLTGPFPNPLGWRHLARSLGLAVTSIDVRSDAFVNPFVAPTDRDAIEVACLGDRVLVPSGTAADEQTMILARRGGVAYLRAVYVRGPGGVELLTAHTTIDLTSAATRLGIADYFAGRRR